MDARKRSEAKRLNLVRYYTGKPCKKGHYADRYATTGACVECLGAAPRQARAKKRRIIPVYDWGFVLIQIRAHPVDAVTVIDCAVAVSKARQPLASQYYVCRQLGGSKLISWTKSYSLEVHPDDAKLLVDMNEALYEARFGPLQASTMTQQIRNPDWEQRFGPRN